MAPDQGLILAPQRVKIQFALEPFLVAVDDLLLLTSIDHQTGFSEWVYQTRTSLSPERRRLHDVVVKGLQALDNDEPWPHLPAYIDYVANEDAYVLRDRCISWMTDPDRTCPQGVDAVDKAALLADVSVYIRFHEALQTAWLERHPDKDAESMDPVFAQEVHALLTNPPRLKAVVTEHLGYMWETILAPEWLRTVTMLEESVAAFEQLDISGLNAQEAIRLVAGREITVHWDLSQVEELTFVPTAHLGPYVRFFTHDNPKIAHIMFGARLPQGTRVQSPALSRSEMLVRLDALADDTRLQILRLLTIHEELCAQDIMIELQLSQSSASRHLRQLAATGYLTERRRDVAKCYSLNLDRVEDTLHALKRYLTTS